MSCKTLIVLVFEGKFGRKCATLRAMGFRDALRRVKSGDTVPTAPFTTSLAHDKAHFRYRRRC